MNLTIEELSKLITEKEREINKLLVELCEEAPAISSFEVEVVAYRTIDGPDVPAVRITGRI